MMFFFPLDYLCWAVPTSFAPPGSWLYLLHGTDFWGDFSRDSDELILIPSLEENFSSHPKYSLWFSSALLSCCQQYLFGSITVTVPHSQVWFLVCPHTHICLDYYILVMPYLLPYWRQFAFPQEWTQIHKAVWHPFHGQTQTWDRASQIYPWTFPKLLASFAWGRSLWAGIHIRHSHDTELFALLSAFSSCS